MYEITKIIYDPKEGINDKLESVYSAISNCGSSALLILVSHKNRVRFYIGTRDNEQPHVSSRLLNKNLKGNFQGLN